MIHSEKHIKSGKYKPCALLSGSHIHQCHKYTYAVYISMLLRAFSQGKWVKHASRFNWHVCCEPHILLTVLLGAHCGFRLIRGSNAPPQHQDRLCQPQGVHY